MRVVRADATAIVLVDHGSKKREANATLDAFAEVYKRRSGREVVEIAHMEIAEPSISQAVGRCVASGATDIVVAPYFLSPGRHVQKDIPALVDEAAREHPGVDVRLAKPIGIDPLVAEIIEARVVEAMSSAPVVEGVAYDP